MRILRFKIRTAMLAVALVAIALGLYANTRVVTAERRARYLRMAEVHRAKIVDLRLAFDLIRGPKGRMQCVNVYLDSIGRTLSETEAQRQRELNEWHDSLAIKYRNAANHPWWTLKPDPPAPQ